MTRKEHLLKLIPDIEYDLPLKKLNLILEAMENHTEEQLQLAAVSQRSELLLFFLSKINKDAIDLYKEGKGQIVVDHFLKNNNCG